jgi:hypothetical protein
LRIAECGLPIEKMARESGLRIAELENNPKEFSLAEPAGWAGIS